MWRPQHLAVPFGTLAWEEKGAGDPLLFLSGGPGDPSGYLRPLAEPLTDGYRCILLDQRGTGASRLERLDEESLSLDHFYGDIEAVRAAVGTERITLVGHSWGGMLAIYFAIRHPRSVKRMILIGMGPLDREGAGVAGANVLKSLTEAEQEELERLSAARKAAVAQGDREAAKAAHIESVRLRLRSLFFDPDAAASFMADFERDYAFDPAVHGFVTAQAQRMQVWGNLGHISAPVLVLYGYQDFEPVTQAFRLQAEMPDVTVRLINRAGHVPWLEQPDAVQAEIRRFLTTNE